MIYHFSAAERKMASAVKGGPRKELGKEGEGNGQVAN